MEIPTLEQILALGDDVAYSFSGESGDLNPNELCFIALVVSLLTNGTSFYSGGATGVDTAAGYAAYRAFPRVVHHLVVPAAPYNRDIHRLMPRAITVQCQRGRTRSQSYMNRNDQLAIRGDALVAFPRHSTNQLRSGTWATIRRAERHGKPVLKFPLMHIQTILDLIQPS